MIKQLSKYNKYAMYYFGIGMFLSSYFDKRDYLCEWHSIYDYRDGFDFYDLHDYQDWDRKYEEYWQKEKLKIVICWPLYLVGFLIT